MFDKPFFTYLGMAIACAAMVLGVLKPDWAPIAWTIAGALGFSSVAALRSMIDSKGWKTYILAGVVIALSIATWVGAISSEIYNELLIVLLPLGGITVQQALAKSSSSIPKVGDK